MRDILFRGKRIDNDEWVYGYYVHIGPVSCKKSYIIPEYASALYVVEVDPATVGQYTGLTDKNGKRIFEGDIVKRFWLGAEIIYCIKYEEENASFIGKALNTSGFTTFDHDGEMFEIIGNIHDNPEFLKEGAE